MTEEIRLGTIEVAPTAIAGIASEAALQCYGVVGLATATLRNGLAELLPGERRRRGVEVRLIDKRIIIDVYVVMEYGIRISEVAHNIMEAVKFSVEKALGMPVAEVNVHVQGLRISSRE